MYRLKTLIKGEASKLIQHLKVTNENYHVAWNLLEHRYANNRLMFTSLVDRLLDQPFAYIDNAKSIKTLLDTTNECVQAIKALGIQIADADPFIAQIIMRKINKEGLRLYEQSIRKPREIQKLDDVLCFLEQQLHALEAVSRKQINFSMNKNNEKPTDKYNSFLVSKNIENKDKQSSNSRIAVLKKCLYCHKLGHLTIDCQKFLAVSTEDRRNFVYNNKLCFACVNHKMGEKCTNNSREKCKKCSKFHNTILHPEIDKTKSAATSSPSQVLLATAQVKVRSASGEFVLLRALVDQGSQITSISEEAAQILSLPRVKSVTEIHGLGDVEVGVSKFKMQFEIRPRYESNTIIKANALVLSRLMKAQPDMNFNYDIESWNNYLLADPLFNKSDRIDIVIGGDLYSDILEEGIIKRDGILGQNTKLGWILSGVLKVFEKPSSKIVATTTLEKFWELEETPKEELISDENKLCWDNFKKTTKIDGDNRIIVRLPFKKDNELGESRNLAMVRFLALEKKLNNNKDLQEEYISFMRDYIKLGHMTEVKRKNEGKYYMPHHAVIKNDSLTTKVRVVFDASAKTSNKLSLNDVLMVGPRLQNEIFNILIKWRKWKFVLTADIEKMYRQIKMSDEDQKYQVIFWREKHHELIKEYKLNTVTYGTSSAPFLAVASLMKVADDCGNDKIKKIIEEDFYMDDLMTGENSIEDCLEIQRGLSEQLKKFGFNLRKWSSNNKQILNAIPDCGNNQIIPIENETVKTLGLQWNPAEDTFTISSNLNKSILTTKRQVLSNLAQIFDPLGWLSPVVIVAKLFMQHLWIEEKDWDETLSVEQIKIWETFTSQLNELKSIKIPRWIYIENNTVLEIHGFADASEKAYAAVVYGKTKDKVVIIAAKTKVNPIKNRKTLPKLELCAAHLLAKLLFTILKSLNIENSKIFTWSDSTIALSWIKKADNKDKFVKTRIIEIKQFIPNAVWQYVPSQENPADVATRGINAGKLHSFSLWWKGPEWLIKGDENWPKQKKESTQVLATTSAAKSHFMDTLENKYSSYQKLIRVVAQVIHFVNKLKKIQSNYYEGQTKAEEVIIRYHQQKIFQEEISNLKQKGSVHNKSKLVSLYPFLDKNNILRVGGRLQNSMLPYNKKHPIILGKSHITTLIAQEIHRSTMHGGVKVMDATLKRSFWVIGAKSLLKHLVRICTTCGRFKNKTNNQIMGDLPSARVNISSPFQHTGIDYAGPLLIKMSRGRGQKSYKGYIAIFVCLATKAVHLEAVSELSTEAFLAALKRFISRRGKCEHIYSDNGTNFVGADRKLKKEYIQAIRNNDSVVPWLSSEKIQWHFIPPAAPHFGGIWEAGVKSVKFHLKRVIGENKLTYEELSTLLTQIEAVLNSRPLYTTGDSIDYIDVITPGHFLIGRPLLDYPENIDDSKISCLNRWKLLQKMRKDYWSRWKDEYLTTLQQRNKWRKPQQNLKSGDIVLVKNEATSPAKWPLAKVSKTHPGKDGKVRVVTLKLQDGECKRPITKICPLISVEEEDSDNTKLKRTHFTRVGNRSSWSKFIWSMLLLLLVSNIQAAPFMNGMAIAALPTESAIYFEEIGVVHTEVSKWNLMVYFDLGPYIAEMRQIPNLMKSLEEQCIYLESYRTVCESLIATFKRRNQILNANNKLLISSERHKRAPFEFIGSLYHMLFGLMDNDDREELKENMQNIFENQKNEKYLIQRQTSVLDSTANVMKKTILDVNKAINSFMVQFKSFETKIVNKINHEQALVIFNILLTQINVMLEECENIQNQIIDLLIDINHNRINPKLLHPNQMQKALEYIKTNIPESYKIPGMNSTNELKEAYMHIRAKGAVIDERLVVQAMLPLIERESSQVWKIFPLPIFKNGSAGIVITKANYIIYNLELNAYKLLTSNEFNDCDAAVEGYALCRDNKPWKSSAEDKCEINALKRSRRNSCTLIKLHSDGFWDQLTEENSWIYAIPDKAQMYVNCGVRKSTWHEIPSKGVLLLKPGCTAVYDRVRLRSKGQNNSKLIIPPKSIVWGNGSIDDNITPSVISINEADLHQIEAVKREIEELKTTHIELKTLRFHSVSGHTSLAIILMAFLILIVVYIRSKCQKPTHQIKIEFSKPEPYSPRQDV